MQREAAEVTHVLLFMDKIPSMYLHLYLHSSPTIETEMATLPHSFHSTCSLYFCQWHLALSYLGV